MNKKRRTQIKEVYAALRDTKDNLEDILTEEQFALDNLPENLQDSERAEAAEGAIDKMDNAVDAIAEAMGYLKEIV